MGRRPGCRCGLETAEPLPRASVQGPSEAQARRAPRGGPLPFHGGGGSSCFCGSRSCTSGACSGVGVQDSEDAGNLRALGRPRSGRVTEPGRARTWAVVGGLEARWGPAGEVLGAPLSPPGSRESPVLREARVRAGGGSGLGASAGSESALGSPLNSPSWQFCPPRVPSSCCRRGARCDGRPTRLACTPARPGLSHSRGPSLYTRCSARGGFPDSARPNAGPGRGERPLALF